MSVQKFRSIEEMNKAKPPERGGSGFEQLLRLCANYWRISPRRYPVGVQKFRSFEEAQKARERHEPYKP